jgi:hypothetical protein
MQRSDVVAGPSCKNAVWQCICWSSAMTPKIMHLAQSTLQPTTCSLLFSSYNLPLLCINRRELQHTRSMSSRPSSYPATTEASIYPLSTFYSSPNAVSDTGICMGTNNGTIAIAISEISGPTSNQAAASASLYTNGNPIGVETTYSTSEQTSLITRWSSANMSL